MCYAIENYPEYVCSLFPSDVACSCPLAAATYYAPNAYVAFGSEWLTINGGVNVSIKIFLSVGRKYRIILSRLCHLLSMLAAREIGRLHHPYRTGSQHWFAYGARLRMY